MSKEIKDEEAQAIARMKEIYHTTVIVYNSNGMGKVRDVETFDVPNKLVEKFRGLLMTECDGEKTITATSHDIKKLVSGYKGDWK
jgi:hypothetical protein